MRYVFLFPLLLAACTATAPAAPPAAPEPAPEARIAAECALLDRAAQMMADAGVPPHEGLREGCPGETTRDSRPLSRQTASLREANSAALPPALTPGTRAEEVFRRTITRGVPVSLVLHLVDDPVFIAAVR